MAFGLGIILAEERCAKKEFLIGFVEWRGFTGNNGIAVLKELPWRP